MKQNGNKRKLVILTGGGTMGHVTPNLALVPKLRQAGYEIHYIGSKYGMEKKYIEIEGIPYYSLSAGKLRRYFDLKNVSDVFRIVKGFAEALAIMNRLKPDVVFSKGGFVSCPVVWAAWIKRVPVVIHESDMTPGLANKLSIPFSTKVCFSFPETAGHLPPGKGIYTGIPIRQELLKGSAHEGRKLCGFNDKKPVIMVIGGSQGSANINSIVRRSLKKLLETFNVCHICGEGNISKELQNMDGYSQFGYVNKELPHLFAVSDMIISRAGATTLFEIKALKKPNLLIPLSIGASRGDQILNAESFRKQGFSCVLREEEMDENSFISSVMKVYKNRMQYIKAMSDEGMEDAVEKIAGILEGVLNQKNDNYDLEKR